MPAKGDWRKPFNAALEMVKDSKEHTLKLCVEAILQNARRDSIIQGGTEIVQRKRGGTFKLYKEHPQADRWSRPSKRRQKARKIFSNSKYFSRSGNLENSLTPSGWSGDHLSTKGEGEADITVNEKASYAIIKFTGEAEGALRGGDAQKGRNSRVEITTPEGTITQNERGRRRLMELAARKVARLFEKTMKSELEKRTRSIT
jgi:hypothetical protein